MTTLNVNRHGEPRCPVCSHFLNSDNAEGWICNKTGGCGSEFGDEFDANGDPLDDATAHLDAVTKRADTALDHWRDNDDCDPYLLIPSVRDVPALAALARQVLALRDDLRRSHPDPAPYTTEAIVHEHLDAAITTLTNKESHRD